MFGTLSPRTNTTGYSLQCRPIGLLLPAASLGWLAGSPFSESGLPAMKKSYEPDPKPVKKPKKGKK